MNSNKCPICGRPTHKTSKYCIFHAGINEKDEMEFKDALNKYIEDVKNKGQGYNFRKFVFPIFVNFEIDFQINVFKNANFSDAIFYKKVIFVDNKFKGKTYFRNVVFNDCVSFTRVVFEDYVNFGNTRFYGDLYFNLIIFKSSFYCKNTYFGGKTTFVYPFFNSEAHFLGSNFTKETSFYNIDSCELLDLSNVKFDAGISLKIFTKITTKSNKMIIDLKKSFMSDIFVEMDLDECVYIDFYNSILRNTYLDLQDIYKHILQKKNKSYIEAKRVFLLLKNNYHSIGRYDEESWSFVEEKDMERMSKSFCYLLNKYKNRFERYKKIRKYIEKARYFKKWLFSQTALSYLTLNISNFIYEYGENPWRVIRFAYIIIFLWAIIFNLTGIVNSGSISSQFNIINENNIYYLKYVGPIAGNIFNCLYFSVVTFTTLGYGDFQPLEGWSRFWASSEALIGAFTMALFVYTFARRTGGR